MFDQITPIILTLNEEPNIGRTLSQLSWARDIVVVDSCSNDRTCEVSSRFPQVRMIKREFDTLEAQWNYAIDNTLVHTEWVLALDADYVTTPELTDEIGALRPSEAVNGYRVAFTYCVYGRRLRGSAYPPVVVLFRRANACYRQDGHAHRVVVDGRVEDLKSIMLHDDRKSVARWVDSQATYQRQEVDKLIAADTRNLTLPDRLRKQKLFTPFLAFIYCLVVKRGILDGKAGVFYAFQRMIAEALLSVYLLDRELSKDLTQDSQLSESTTANCQSVAD